mgnify:CR=1 FL=1
MFKGSRMIIIILIYNGTLAGLSPLALGIGVIKSAANTLLNFYMFSIFISILMSWIAQGSYNPLVALLHQITEPVMAPARKILPPMGGLDLSPMIILVLMLIMIKS